MTEETLRIDAHQHFWTVARGDYSWLTPDLAGLYRDYHPQHLIPHLADAQIDGTILVQAAPTVAETEFLLSIADDCDFIKGVVGWVNFESIDAPAQIKRLAAHPALVGLRPMIQDINNNDWMLKSSLTPAFEALTAANVTFDALVLPRHLKKLSTLLFCHPHMRVVIDHGAKPQIRDGDFDEWAADMTALANNSHAYCKMSGLITEAAKNWTVSDLRPFVDHLLATFGPRRLIWGSDWPVCTLAGTYEDWFAATEILLSKLTDEDRQAILGGNAGHAYHLRN